MSLSNLTKDILSKKIDFLNSRKIKSKKFLSQAGLLLILSFLLIILYFLTINYFTINGQLEMIKKIEGFSVVFFIIGLAFFIYISYLIFRYFDDLEKINQITKVEIYKPIINELFWGANYNPSGGMNKFNFQNLGLFDRVRIDNFSSEDEIQGSFKKLSFKIQEVKASYEKKTRNHEGKERTQTIQVFKGLILETEFSVHLNSSTLVYPKKYKEAKNYVGDKVFLESPLFEKHFEVFSTDQVEARIHLKTHFMSRLLDFLENNPNKEIFLAFLPTKLIFCIDEKTNLFSVNLFQKFELEKIIAKIETDLSLIQYLIEELDFKRV